MGRTDAMMRLASVVSPAGGSYGSPSGEFVYSYSGGMDQPELITRPTQNGYNDFYIDFDNLARPSETIVHAPPIPSDFTYFYYYDAGSELTQQVYATANKINYTYDNIGQVKSANGFESDGTTPRLQEQFGYGYDKAWNLNERTNNALIQSFAVNNVNELTNASRSGTLTVAGTTTEAGSDIASVTVNGVTANEYADGTFVATNFTASSGTNTYTAIAEDDLSPPRWSTNSVTVYLPSSGNYTNDSNGNLTSDGMRNFAYDDENELVGVWEANTWSNSFAYDGLQRKRIEKDYSWNGTSWQETNELHYVYDGNLVFQERDGNNIPLTTYTRGIDLSGTFQGAGGAGGLLARSDRQGIVPAILNPEYPNPQGVVTSYYSYDANGNVATLTSPYGMLLAQYVYDPFGNMISMSGLMASVNKYRFSTKEWNDNEGLYYYGRRIYDPKLQRWLNRDPIQEMGGINLFAFVSNDPLGLLDQFGLCPNAAEEEAGAEEGTAEAGVEEAAGEGGAELGLGELAGPITASFGAGYGLGTLINDYTPVGDLGTWIGNWLTPLDPPPPTSPRPNANVNPGLAMAGSSINQVNKAIQTGKAPNSIERAEAPRYPYEQDHIHFKDGNALNRDGTWKHGGRPLTNAEKDFCSGAGFTLP